MKRTLLLSMLALVACDLDSLFTDAADAAEKKAASEAKRATKGADTPTPPTPEEAAEAALPGPVAECLAACDADTEMSTTDRATCRLNCEQTGPEGKASSGKTALQRFSACADACQEKSKTDAETCRLNCSAKTASELADREGGGSEQF